MIQDQLLLLDGLRAGEEAAFATLVRLHGPAMLRVAQLYVRSRAVAEEVVQDAWIGVLDGVGRFEGRSSLKTWIFRILANKAKTRAAREARTIPFSTLDPGEPAVDPDRFRGPEDRYPGHWASPPSSLPEERLLESETVSLVEREIDKLPPAQALVVTMRDVEGFDSEEVCNALDISETNQRVLLHRARSKLRNALEDYMNAA